MLRLGYLAATVAETPGFYGVAAMYKGYEKLS